MDYEKEYKAALERCREFYAKLGNKQLKEEVEGIFPELIESREDEMIRIIKEVILNSVPYKINILTKDTTINAEEAITWLESLRPQSQWRPSDEQMEALSKAIAFVFDSNSDVKHSLESLYNELKKL